MKAAKADRFLFTRQTFVEFPDLRVSGPGFKDAKKITDANPQQTEYMWGRRILFDYKNKDGVRLQGILALPDDYKDGEKRPMIVTFYEKNSQNLHRYNAPSYLTGMGGSPMEAVSRGYLTMLPDIHFRTGSSHSDMLEGRRSRDPQGDRDGLRRSEADRHHRSQLRRRGRGVHRHAVEDVRGRRHGRRRHRPVQRLQPELGLGLSGQRRAAAPTAFDYYLYGQGRWGFSPWDNPERYRFESALTHAPKVTVPFLIMHGTADPTVDFKNGLALLQRAALQRQEGGPARLPGRRPRPARHGEPEGPDDRATSSSSITT